MAALMTAADSGIRLASFAIARSLDSGRIREQIDIDSNSCKNNL